MSVTLIFYLLPLVILVVGTVASVYGQKALAIPYLAQAKKLLPTMLVMHFAKK